MSNNDGMMSAASNNNNNNNNNNSNNIYENQTCTFCLLQGRTVIETEVLYQRGFKKRLGYLCLNECYHTYLDQLGLRLTVAGLFDKAYDVIFSIFTSSPLLWASSVSHKSGGKSNMSLLKVLNIAYHISADVREYLGSVDRDKVPEIISLDNPRVFPIIYKLLYAEDRY